jgi:hypothetical protein
MLLMVVPAVFGAGFGEGLEPLLEEPDGGGEALDGAVEAEEVLEPVEVFQPAGIVFAAALLGKEAAPPQPVITAIPALSITLRTKTGTERILQF